MASVGATVVVGSVSVVVSGSGADVVAVVSIELFVAVVIDVSAVDSAGLVAAVVVFAEEPAIEGGTANLTWCAETSGNSASVSVVSDIGVDVVAACSTVVVSAADVREVTTASSVGSAFATVVVSAADVRLEIVVSTASAVEAASVAVVASATAAVVSGNGVLIVSAVSSGSGGMVVGTGVVVGSGIGVTTSAS